MLYTYTSSLTPWTQCTMALPGLIDSITLYHGFIVFRLVASQLTSSCINEEDGYLLPTWAQKITCRHFNWMLQLIIRVKVKEVWTNSAIYSHAHYWGYTSFYSICCRYLYRRGRTVKSGSEEIYMQDIVMKNKAVETEGEDGSISEEENEESAL